MSEYIIHYKNAETLYEHTDFQFLLEEYLREPIVRCRDCAYYYEAEEYHPQGNYNRRCCKYFDAYDDEVAPDGFCKWGERRDS